jgi:hypothetical protein
MRSHLVQKRLLVLVAASSLALAACGGSGDDNTESQDNGKTTTTTASGHDHDMGDMPGMDHSQDGSSAGEHSAPPQLAEPLALTPEGTIDAEKVNLGGVAGVTPEEQKRAEDLLKKTIEILPKWNDYKTAEADGFHSIGDGVTGEEHFLHWDWINDDDHVLDPNYPEALVYKTGPNNSKTLEAAMFILPEKYNLDNAPDIGGALTQYHIHDNLCFTADLAPHVAGLTNAQGGCNPPLVKFNPNIMIHVWIRPNDCGPFAALLGVGAGQIKPGEQRACDHDHGKLTL